MISTPAGMDWSVTGTDLKREHEKRSARYVVARMNELLSRATSVEKIDRYKQRLSKAQARLTAIEMAERLEQE